MTVRVGINGFGRMGRLGLRAAWGFDARDATSIDTPRGPWGDGVYDIVHVNEAQGGTETGAHLLAFDSVHGRWPVACGASDKVIRVGLKEISYTNNVCLEDTDWAGIGIDLVVEASGKFKSSADLNAYHHCA